jgi:hypothetical protein
MIRYNSIVKKSVTSGRKPSIYPIQRLTVQATNAELDRIKAEISTRQRTKILLRAIEKTRYTNRWRLRMTLFYDRDDRSHSPNVDNRRWGQFKIGWNDFVNGNHMGTEVLIDRLTYNNLGYRMAATHNAAFTADENEPLVRQAYDLAVAFQTMNLDIRGGKAPGNRPLSDSNLNK